MGNIRTSSKKSYNLVFLDVNSFWLHKVTQSDRQISPTVTTIIKAPTLPMALALWRGSYADIKLRSYALVLCLGILRPSKAFGDKTKFVVLVTFDPERQKSKIYVLV